MTDERKHWEVVWCLRIQTAADYIRYLAMVGRQRTFAARAYASGGNLEQWAQEQIEQLIKKANAMVAENGPPSALALSVASPYVAELEKAGCLNGPVQVAGISKIDQV